MIPNVFVSTRSMQQHSMSIVLWQGGAHSWYLVIIKIYPVDKELGAYNFVSTQY